MFFGVYNTTNDSGSDTCSEKAEKSSHETDEAASSQEDSAHIAAQNIESEATRKSKWKVQQQHWKKVQVTLNQKLATLIRQTIAQRRWT